MCIPCYRVYVRQQIFYLSTAAKYESSFNIELASNAPLSVDSQSSQFDVESAFYTLTGAHYQDQVWSFLPAFELLPIDWSRQKTS